MATNKDESEDDFQEKMREVVQHGFEAVSIAIGSRLGLFEAMAGFSQPMTSNDISSSLGYKERYVREWLGSMVCSRIIDYNKDSATYFFPPHRHNALTDKGGVKCVGTFIWAVPIAASAMFKIEQCFRLDGPSGLSYNDYPGFHEWREARVTTQMTEQYLMSIFKQDEQFMHQLELGVTVCDIGCSCGIQLFILAKLFPNSTFLGTDIDQETMDTANQKATAEGIKNLSFAYQDIFALSSEWTDKWDIIMVFDVIHDLPYPAKGLSEIYRVLKPGGLFYMMDYKTSSDLAKNIHAGGIIAYTMSLFHCMPVSLFHKDGAGLGTAWGVELARKMLTEANFKNVKELKGPEPILVHFLCQKTL